MNSWPVDDVRFVLAGPLFLWDLLQANSINHLAHLGGAHRGERSFARVVAKVSCDARRLQRRRTLKSERVIIKQACTSERVIIKQASSLNKRHH